MRNIFKPKVHPTIRPNQAMLRRFKTVRYDNKSLKSLGWKIWNNSPTNIKSEISFRKFKEYIETWFRSPCRCNVCARI